MAGHPEVQARVAAELDAHGLLAGPKNPTPRRPTYADLAALPYLDAVLRESLRIMPVSVFMYRETVDPVTDIGGFAVPADTEVMVRAAVPDMHMTPPFSHFASAHKCHCLPVQCVTCACHTWRPETSFHAQLLPGCGIQVAVCSVNPECRVRLSVWRGRSRKV